MFSAISKTLGQLNDPAIRRVIAKTLGLAILGYIVFVVLDRGVLITGSRDRMRAAGGLGQAA